MEEGRIRVGLAGFGMSGRLFQAPFIDADPRYQLKKVFERKTDRAKQDYPKVEVVRNFEQLLTQDIDLVVIATPNPYHVPMAAAAMKAGKHVVVEKPAAAASKEAEELYRISKKEHVIFSVYQNRRLDGDFLTVKKLIEEDQIGEVVDYECHFDRFAVGKSAKQWKADGGAGIDLLYDIGVHLIDQAYSLFGMPDEVYADLRKQRAQSSGVDNFQVYLYYASRKVCLSASELAAMPGPHFIVHGRKGSFLKYGRDVQESCLLQGMRPGASDWGQEEEEFFGTLCMAADQAFVQKKMPTLPGNYGKYYDNLYDVIRNGKELLVKPKEAIEVLRIIEAAQQSSALKRRICIDCDIPSVSNTARSF